MGQGDLIFFFVWAVRLAFLAAIMYAAAVVGNGGR
jgi:hypothetical protein